MMEENIGLAQDLNQNTPPYKTSRNKEIQNIERGEFLGKNDDLVYKRKELENNEIDEKSNSNSPAKNKRKSKKKESSNCVSFNLLIDEDKNRKYSNSFLIKNSNVKGVVSSIINDHSEIVNDEWISPMSKVQIRSPKFITRKNPQKMNNRKIKMDRNDSKNTGCCVSCV